MEFINIPGVMTREMVKHKEGRSVYASAEELQKAVEQTDMLPICMYREQEHGPLDLPNEEIIGMGFLTFEDGKVKTELVFDPERMTEDQFNLLNNLEKDNLSPAFLSNNVKEKGIFDGHAYEEKQTDIQFKHIAVVSKGVCSSLHGCGLYMENFESINTESAKLERCVEHVKAKGWSEEKAWAICKSKIKESDDVQNLNEDEFISVNDTSNHVNIKRESTMTEECIKKKMDAGMSKEEAEKACAPKKEATESEDKIAALEAKLEALTGKLEKVLEIGQDITAQTEAKKEEEPEEEKDAEYEPGTWVPTGYDYSQGLNMKSAIKRKKVA